MGGAESSKLRPTLGVWLTIIASFIAAPIGATEVNVRLKYFHGGLHSVVSREDRHVADFLREHLDAVEMVEAVDFDALLGDVREDQVTGAILENLAETPDRLFLVGYSAGAGTLLDILAGRHLNSAAQEDRALILENLEDTECMFVLVDPYMGGIPRPWGGTLIPPAPFTEQQKENLLTFVRSSSARAVVILHDNDGERPHYNILDRIVEEAVEMLKPLSGERFLVVALEDFNHANIINDPEQEDEEGLQGASSHVQGDRPKDQHAPRSHDRIQQGSGLGTSVRVLAGKGHKRVV